MSVEEAKEIFVVRVWKFQSSPASQFPTGGGGSDREDDNNDNSSTVEGKA